jgi:hypothetical protein
MQCPKDFAWELYLDNEVRPAEKEVMEDHLAHCRDCRDRVAGFKHQSDLIWLSLAGTPLPADLEDYIKKRLHAGEAADTRLIWITMPLAVLAGLFILSAAGVWGLLEGLVSFLKIMGGNSLLPEALLLAAAVLKDLAGVSLRGGVALPSLVILLFCLLWIKFKLRKGGQVHA